MKKKYLLLIPFLALLAWAAWHPITVNDTFFGIKMGELVVHSRSVPTREIFSWSAYGRDFVAFEWLAQTIIYLIYSLSGFFGLQVYVSAMLMVIFLSCFLIFKTVFRQSFFASLMLSLLAASFISEFYVARPYVIAFLCFVTTIGLLLNEINYQPTSLLGTKKLFYSLPVTYLWINSHGSFIFIPFLFFSYGFLSFFYFKINSRLKRGLRTFKTLIFFGVLNFLVTLLPPLFYKPYLLLWQFLLNIRLISEFISEWRPLTYNSAYLISYSLLIFLTLVVLFSLSFKRGRAVASRWLLVLPLLGISFFSFSAIRHVSFGAISAVFALAFFLPSSKASPRQLKIAFSLMTIVIVLSTSLIVFKKISNEAQSDHDEGISLGLIKYLKDNNLQGRMYNPFSQGGLLIYYLYPKYQVFYDGRVEVYYCCEISSFSSLASSRTISNDLFENKLDNFINKYRFSFFVFTKTSLNPFDQPVSSYMGDVLAKRGEFRIIYFDDTSEVLIRNDGQNNALFQSGLVSAAPFALQPYRDGDVKGAEKEYLRMIAIADSALARSDLGFVYLKEKKIDRAKGEFEKSIELNSHLGRAYLGLGETESQTDSGEAISILNQAANWEPYLGQTYLDLADNYLKLGLKQQAASSLREGLSQNIDLLSRQKIVQRLNNL